jgi:hypothetical protein
MDSTPDKPADSSQPPEPAPPATTSDPTSRDRWTLIFAGGMGGAIGVALYQGCFGDHGIFTHPTAETIIPIVILTPLMVWLTIKYVEPWQARRRAAQGKPVHHPKFKIWRWTLHGSAASVIIVAFEEIYRTMAHHNFGWAGAWLMTSVVTACWVQGARLRPRQSALLGAVGPAFVSFVLTGATFLILFGSADPEKIKLTGGQTPAQAAVAEGFNVSLIILTEGLFWAVIGGGVGLYLDLSRSARPAKVLFIMLIVSTMLASGGHKLLGVSWLEVLKDHMRSLAWGIAILWCGVADKVLGSSPSPAAEAH